MKTKKKPAMNMISLPLTDGTTQGINEDYIFSALAKPAEDLTFHELHNPMAGQTYVLVTSHSGARTEFFTPLSVASVNKIFGIGSGFKQAAKDQLSSF